MGERSVSISTERIAEFLEQFADGAIVYDGFEGAFIGCVQRCGSPAVAVYSWDKMMDILMERDGMDFEEADEYLSFNVLGGYIGESTPYILFEMDGRNEA